MTEQTMVERVAIALCEGAWSVESRKEKYYWRSRAALAIEAMREPTDAMIEAGLDYDEKEFTIRTGKPPTVEQCQIGEWQAQIDAALADPK